MKKSSRLTALALGGLVTLGSIVGCRMEQPVSRDLYNHNATKIDNYLLIDSNGDGKVDLITPEGVDIRGAFLDTVSVPQYKKYFNGGTSRLMSSELIEASSEALRAANVLRWAIDTTLYQQQER